MIEFIKVCWLFLMQFVAECSSVFRHSVKNISFFFYQNVCDTLQFLLVALYRIVLRLFEGMQGDIAFDFP